MLPNHILGHHAHIKVSRVGLIECRLQWFGNRVHLHIGLNKLQ